LRKFEGILSVLKPSIFALFFTSIIWLTSGSHHHFTGYALLVESLLICENIGVIAVKSFISNADRLTRRARTMNGYESIVTAASIVVIFMIARNAIYQLSNWQKKKKNGLLMVRIVMEPS
jgi:hypothetical protein